MTEPVKTIGDLLREQAREREAELQTSDGRRAERTGRTREEIERDRIRDSLKIMRVPQ